MPFISSFKIINVVRFAKSECRAPDSKIFLRIAASVADATAVNPNVIKTLLANGLSKFFNKSNPIFSNGPKSILKNPPDCPNLCN